MKTLVLAASSIAAMTIGGSYGNASSLDEIFAVTAETNRFAQASQVRIDGLSDETASLLEDYKKVLKEIEGLRVYNAQLDRQIRNQEREISDLSTSIEEVTLIERQITPLMLRMLATLEEFIEHDVPFQLDERNDRIMRLQEMMDAADVSPSEKFRRIFEAYQIENDYGRTIEAYEDSLSLDGAEREVYILRIGRVGLYYQTKDASASGMWNQADGTWDSLDDDFGSAITQGIRIAQNQTSPNLINLPVVAPE